MQPMNRTVYSIVLGCVLWMCAACGNADPSPSSALPQATGVTATATTHSPASPVTPALASKLLSDDDLPPGWYTFRISVESSSSSVCGAPTFDRVFRDASRAYIGITGGPENQLVFEELWQTLDDASAADAFAEIIANLSCEQWTDFDSTTWAVEHLASPGLGDESVAYRFVTTSLPTADDAYAVIVRQANTIAIMVCTGGDFANVLHISELAIDKLRN